MSGREGEAADLAEFLEALDKSFSESFALITISRCEPGERGFICTMHVGVELGSASYTLVMSNEYMRSFLDQVAKKFNDIMANVKRYIEIKELAETAQPTPPQGRGEREPGSQPG